MSTPIDTMTALESLQSELCPACGKTKKSRQSVCGTDYRRLPGRLKADLYKRIGNGYEQALADSLTALGTVAPFWPGDSTL